MNTRKKITGLLLATAALGLGTSAYAQDGSKITQLDREELQELRKSGDREAFRSKAQELGIQKRLKPKLTDEQKEALDELRELDDQELIKNQLESWGIDKPSQQDRGNGLKIGHDLQNLSEEQKQEIEELRESGVDKEVVREKLLEFGVELPAKINITDEQKEKIQELREVGDRDELMEYFQEIGLSKKRVKIQKRKEFSSSLSDDEKEVLKEARDIAKAGDKETAKEMIEEIFGANEDLEKPKRGILGFFKRLF